VTDDEQDEQFYRDTESITFPKLNDYQLSLLQPLGQTLAILPHHRWKRARAQRRVPVRYRPAARWSEAV